MSQVLLDVFASFCVFGAGRRKDVPKSTLEMDNVKFMKFCRECCLLDECLTKIDADLLFQKSKPLRARKVGWAAFVDMFCEIARRKGVSPEDLEDHILRSGGRPLQANSALRHTQRTTTNTTTPPTGSIIEPLSGEELPSAIGRVLPWESPNWSFSPHLMTQAGWRPGGSTAPQSQPQAVLDDSRLPTPESVLIEARARSGGGDIIKGATAASVYRSLSQGHGERRRRVGGGSFGFPVSVGMMPSVRTQAVERGGGGGGGGGGGVASTVRTLSPRHPHPFDKVGSVESPLTGGRLPREIGRVLPWESPNWRALPQAPELFASPRMG